MKENITNRVIDGGISNPSDVLDESGHGLRSTKKCEGLIDEVGTEVECLSRCRLGFVFPRTLE